ncbi:MAG: zinc-binding dehydrogenase [Gammaproteobacteria bacterium]|nr:zinc-binding dehydrogenase [Gammaproteobacteria bacterium]
MTTTKQLFSTVSSQGNLTVELKTVELAEPKDHEVIVKIELAPINPSDMWPMFSLADLSQAKFNPDSDGAKLTAPLFPGMTQAVRTRLDQACPVGNEASGIVVKTGSSDAAKALMGKRVAILSGSTFAEYSCAPAQMCLPHAETTTAEQACSSFVNPLTALCMIETMRKEGHKALVHTAAASNLGQMLNRICIADGIDLINIVRKPEQEQILRDIGAKYVVNSSSESYMSDLYMAIKSTGATLAFDATGGGQLASDILTAMEAVLTEGVTGLNTYGAPEHKQVYLYGGLDVSPTMLKRAYGMSWGIGGWLLMRTLATLEPNRVIELNKRVATEIGTTFASTYSGEFSLEEMLKPENIALYNAKKTGEKYLVNPTK